MSTEKMREEFEAWASDRLGLTTRKLSSRLYQSFGMHTAWEAWQASRADIEVELPYDSDALNGDHDFIKGWRLGVKDTVLSIESLGLKVKP